MGAFQKRLTELEPDWLKALDTPRRTNPRTPTKLRIRIEALAVRLRRRRRPIKDWPLRWLYYAWYELSAELILKRRYPEIHSAIRAAQDKRHKVATST